MMVKVEELSASLQDYLEAIFWIIADKGVARTKDIAKRLGVKAGSVTGALQTLSRKHFIDYAPYEVITLTSSGLKEAKRIIRKHELLRDFFVQILAVEPGIAEADACKIEHMISDEVFSRMVAFFEFIQTRQKGGKNWIKQFHKYYGAYSKE